MTSQIKRKIPKRQKLAQWLDSKVPLLPEPLERLFIKIPTWVAGPEPHFWMHYGKDCICCKWGWHK